MELRHQDWVMYIWMAKASSSVGSSGVEERKEESVTHLAPGLANIRGEPVSHSNS